MICVQPTMVSVHKNQQRFTYKHCISIKMSKTGTLHNGELTNELTTCHGNGLRFHTAETNITAGSSNAALPSRALLMHP